LLHTGVEAQRGHWGL